jgi:hypothetical protein
MKENNNKDENVSCLENTKANIDENIDDNIDEFIDMQNYTKDPRELILSEQSMNDILNEKQKNSNAFDPFSSNGFNNGIYNENSLDIATLLLLLGLNFNNKK